MTLQHKSNLSSALFEFMSYSTFLVLVITVAVFAAGGDRWLDELQTFLVPLALLWVSFVCMVYVRCRVEVNPGSLTICNGLNSVTVRNEDVLYVRRGRRRNSAGGGLEVADWPFNVFVQLRHCELEIFALSYSGLNGSVLEVVEDLESRFGCGPSGKPSISAFRSVLLRS
jgi:hypothetical protein